MEKNLAAFQFCILFIFILFFSVSPTVNAEIYKWTDSAGKIQFSDVKPKSLAVETIELTINSYENVSIESVFNDDDKSNKNKTVIMYSTEWCGYCKMARAYFKKKQIPFTEYDIEKNKSAKKKYALLKASGVPVILTGGKRMNGFSISGFEKMYQE